MDASAVLTLVQTFLQVLDSPISREIQSAFGYASQLKKLRKTISTIEAVLVNVEKQERLRLPTSISGFTLDRLKEAVYEADDLFDEIATMAQRKKLSGNNKLSQEVRLFFSRFNHFYYAFTKSREIKGIREELDDIAKDHRDFGFMQGQVPTLEVGNHSRETHSFVCEEDVIIGRDEDKQIVIDMLLDTTTVEEAISVVSLVGMGGLGKTTLAQLVYNDEQIQKEFQLKMWVCVSDDFNVKTLLYKVLAAAATNQNNNGDLTLDQLQSKLRKELEGKKYILVLDDMWNEDSNKWLELRNLLIQGGSGSRIFVTTRSMKVANVVRSHHTHELEGLSDEESWKLFERMTLEPGQVQLEAPFVESGNVIIRKCANVPLAIRVMASLLRGKGESAWKNLQHADLANMDQDEAGGIIPVLKISYNYLPSHLKNCFSYCAVFPKDHVIEKDDLIYFWMAQGFIAPFAGQSFEDLGEEYFNILLQRCFFQNVIRDHITGVIVSCKMHDLVHDLAKEVAGSGVKCSGNDITSLNDKTRHIFIDKPKNVECYLTKMKRLRTCLVCHKFNFIHFDGWIPKMRYLRVLDLSNNYVDLSSMIGQLVRLRYLDISCNYSLSVLPNSITQLYNLQTLKLGGCSALEELPRELSKLVNLRHLDIHGCKELRHMPPGMNRMTCLHKLTMFALGGGPDDGCCFGLVDVGKLRDLKDLTNLRGKIYIRMREGWTKYDAAVDKEGGYLINKPLLNKINISWDDESLNDDNVDNVEALLKGLQPHPHVKKLGLHNYAGVKFPSWGEGDSLTMNLSKALPNLVELKLKNCTRLKHVPLLSQLRHLKVLTLLRLSELEYVESRDNGSTRSGDGAATASATTSSGGRGTRQAHDEELVFFPSLERLVLWDLPKLKGWWKAASHSDSDSDSGEGNNNDEQLQQQQESSSSSSSIVAFPRLSHLEIWDCPNLTTFPSLPNVKELSLYRSHKALRYYDSLPRESFQHLSSLSIWKDEEIERLSTMEVFRSGCMSSLRSLKICNCSKFKSILERGGLEHFTSLETLALESLWELEMEEKEGENEADYKEADMPWRCLAPSLRELSFFSLPKMVGKLPKGMRHLTALRSLSIHACKNLEEIPPWISSLTSLHRLELWNCPKVKSLPQEV